MVHVHHMHESMEVYYLHARKLLNIKALQSFRAISHILAMLRLSLSSILLINGSKRWAIYNVLGIIVLKISHARIARKGVNARESNAGKLAGM